jgi:hypothetical protein
MDWHGKLLISLNRRKLNKFILLLKSYKVDWETIIYVYLWLYNKNINGNLAFKVFFVASYNHLMMFANLALKCIECKSIDFGGRLGNAVKEKQNIVNCWKWNERDEEKTPTGKNRTNR